MDQRIIDLFDEYTHKPLSRAEFLKRLASMVGSTAAALAVLPLLEPNYAHAQTAPTAADLKTEHIQYPFGDKSMRAYLAQPVAAAPRAAVVVIHENRGLNAHIEDVARRVAQAGYIALAPDALSLVGGTPPDADKAREMFQQLDTAQTVQAFAAAFDHLRTLPGCTGRVGCVGFCWGGAMANSLAVQVPTLQAAVAFYGRQPDLALVPKIKAALLLHYAEKDERVNAGMAAYEAALKAAGVRHEQHLYVGAQHAFHNDTSAARYDAAAAQLAWQRTLAFFKQHLST